MSDLIGRGQRQSQRAERVCHGTEPRVLKHDMKMHAGEVDSDEELVRRLVAAQFPQLLEMPIRAVRSTATVNAIYRLGDHLGARPPRVPSWVQDLERELHWLPK
jgi:hypothetical protein